MSISANSIEQLRDENRSLQKRIAKLEQDQKAGNDSFRSIVEKSLATSYKYNLETGSYDYMSPACEKLFGYTPEEIIAGGLDTTLSRFHPDDRKRLEQNTEELLSQKIDTNTISVIEYRYKHKEHGYRWIRNARFIERNSSGVPLAVVGSSYDITDQKEAEQVLQKARASSEANYRLLMENSTDVIWTMDLDQNFTYVSPSIERIFGYTVAQAISNRMEDTQPPASLQVILNGIRKALERGMEFSHPTLPLSFEVQQYRADRSLIWCEVIISFLQNPQTGEIYLQGVTRDITDRKIAHEKLETLQQQVELVLGTSNTGLDIHDADYNLHYVNLERQKIYGDPVGKKCYEYFHNASSPCSVCPGIKAIQTNQTVVSEADRRGRKFLITCVPFTDNSGERLVAEVIIDITQRRQTEEALRQSEQQLLQAQRLETVGTLAGGIAHDVNNILQSIFNNLFIVQEELPEDHPATEPVLEILKAGKRAKEIINQILTFSRRVDHAVKPIKIAPLVEEITKFLIQTAPDNVRVTPYINPDSGTVSADSTQIHQVLLNLATNALQAMETQKGTIEIGVEPLDRASKSGSKSTRYAHIYVKDTGDGIAEKDLSRIFDPFFTTKPVGKGTGLGLSVAHGIITAHGGKIEVQSIQGKGTTFHLFLPVIAPEKPTAKKQRR